MTDKARLDNLFSPVNRPLSLAAEVEVALRKAIQSGVFSTGPLPPLGELSRQLCVSRETIRIALRSLEEENLIVRQSRNRRYVRNIGLIDCTLNSQENPQFTTLGYLEEEYELERDNEIVGLPQSKRMLSGVLAEAANQHTLIIVRRAKSFQLRQVFFEMKANAQIQGMIFSSVSDEQFLKDMCKQGLPAVMLDHDLNLPKFDSIRPDSKQNAEIAVQHLVALGHKRIVCANWLQTDVNPWFIQGYRQGMRNAKLPRCKDWEIGIKLNESGALESLNRILSLTPRPTAVICFHNTLAGQIFAIANQAGLQIPLDLSVMGGGGEKVTGLTCTHLDWAKIGAKSVKMLLKAIAEGESHEPVHTLVDYDFNERAGNTTAAPRG